MDRGRSTGRCGECNILSLRKDGERLATVELVKGTNKRPALGQVRGPRNTIISKEIEKLLRHWVKSLPATPEKAPCVPTRLHEQDTDDIPPF